MLNKIKTTEESIADEIAAFGADAWVYCRPHVNPHLTGWCGIEVFDKIGLGLKGQDNKTKAYQKCRECGLPIFGEKKT